MERTSIKFFKWNPKYLTAASAAQNLSLWLPRNLNNSNVANLGQPKKSSMRKPKVTHHSNSNNKK